MARYQDEDEQHVRIRNRKPTVQKYKPDPNAAPIEGREAAQGQVVTVGHRTCKVINETGLLTCRNQLPLAPGDFVALTAEHRVARILPRKTSLSRPDPGNPNRERVAAANMDLVVIVAAAADPPLRPGLIDRYLIAIERGGADAVVCINKCEMVDRNAIEDALRPYAGLAMPVVFCSARTGAGIEDLHALIDGKLCVFVGQSGVGKSSLLNALMPTAGAATGETSKATGKGQHTTTRSQIYDLAGGARVIDTPGVREFGLWQLDPAEVRQYFHDFDEASAECRFPDCSHLHEPGCMVRTQVEAGIIALGRYERYRRICESADESEHGAF